MTTAEKLLTNISVQNQKQELTSQERLLAITSLLAKAVVRNKQRQHQAHNKKTTT